MKASTHCNNWKLEELPTSAFPPANAATSNENGSTKVKSTTVPMIFWRDARPGREGERDEHLLG